MIINLFVSIFLSLYSDESVQEIRNEIFVANLPRKCDYNDLKDFCARYGEIREIDMKYDNRTGKFRGFAIIKYNEDSCAEAAVEDSNRYRIQGRRISISYNKKRQAKKSTKTGDETCWFCFNNKDIERHLICNVGKELYVALPKGPVVDHHFLIIPKNHIQGTLALPESARNELEKTKKMLTDFITEHDENDYFIFERNLPLKFENAMHMNLQVISLPPGAYDLDDRIQDMLRASMLEFEVLSGPVEEAFREETEAGETEKYYLYFEYPGLRTAKGRGKVRLLVKVPKESNTNHLMQLGRVMVCELLEAREKANWKACELSKEEEISIVKKVTPMLEKYK